MAEKYNGPVPVGDNEERHMRLAVLSDIHGNLEALESVLADLEQVGSPDVTWVLGDLALFGSRPQACIQRVRDLPNVHVIQGNTDRYVVTGVRPGLPAADDEAAWASIPRRTAGRDATFLWTTERLSYADYTYLRDLPTELALKIDGFGTLRAFHAAPGDDEFGFFPDTPDAVMSEKLAGSPARLVMVGHTHVAMDRQGETWRVLNPGSVGAPFDEDPRAAYAVLDFDDAGTLTLDRRRVPYDIERAVEQLHALGQPIARLQEARLRTGMLHPPVPPE